MERGERGQGPCDPVEERQVGEQRYEPEQDERRASREQAERGAQERQHDQSLRWGAALRRHHLAFLRTRYIVLRCIWLVYDARHGSSASARAPVARRREWDSNPRWVAPH